MAEKLEHLRPINPKPRNLYIAINKIIDELIEINKKLAKTHRKTKSKPKKAI